MASGDTAHREGKTFVLVSLSLVPKTGRRT